MAINWIKLNRVRCKYITIEQGGTFGKNFRCEPIIQYQNQKFSPKITIGRNVHIEDFVHIGCTNKIEIGDNTVIASKVYITDHNHGYYDIENIQYHENPKLIPPMRRKLTSNSCVKIGMNVWIGESVTILPGSVIGDGVIIGSNSVVRGNIDEYSIAVGIPAKVIKRYDFCKNKWVGFNEN